VALDRIHATVGEIEARGEYRFELGAAKPHRFRVAVPKLDAAVLEQLLMPTLKRNNGLIARAFGFGRAPIPDWLRARHADGLLQVDSLEFPGVIVTRLRSRMIWNGTSLTLADLTGAVQNGTVTGRLTIDLRGTEPAYRLAPRLKSVEWSGGKFDAEAVLDTKGTGQALLANLRSEGSFTGTAFEDDPLDQFESVSSCYVLEWARPSRVRFTDLHLSTGSEVFSGRGALQEDGRLSIQVSNGSRLLNVTGTLAQIHLDSAATQ
jgi:hypothetical protein